MLAEGMVHILASDAHNTKSRPPILSEAFDIASQEVGLDEAQHLVLTRPQAILENRAVEEVVPLPILPKVELSRPSLLRRMFLGSKA